MLDTLRDVETPEGVNLRLRPAGVFARAQAWVVDVVICGVVLLVCSGILNQAGHSGVGLLLLLYFTLVWGYDVVCDIWFAGRTPGKRLLDLQVISADGTPVSPLQSAVRNLLRTVDILPGIGYGLGMISCLVDPASRRIGDIVAGTLVVHISKASRGGAVPLFPAHPLPVPLDEDEQAAILAFAERAPYLTIARQEELADILYPLTGCQGAAGIERLNAYANALLGRP